MTTPPDLSVLLCRTLFVVTRCYGQAGAARGDVPSLAMQSCILGNLDDHGVEMRSLPARARLSRRAVISGVTGARNHGWAEVTTPGRPKVSSIARLSEGGVSAMRRWPAVARRAMRAWTGLVGDATASDLRDVLADIVATFELEHPHYPVSYGGSDPSVSGGPGVDWKPVRRHGDGDAGRLGIAALLSQAIVSFALDYERRVRFPLAPTANVLYRFRDGHLDLATAQPLGIAGNGRSGLERHGIVRVSTGGDRVATLTSLGRRLLSAYEPAVQAIERDWEERFGAGRVNRLRRLLATGVPTDDTMPRHLMVTMIWQ